VKNREPRRSVRVRARIRTGAEWGDVVIHNMSAHGMLVAADAGSRPGTVIEIRRVHHIVIGRVVWQQGLYMGVRTQDVIDVDGIVSAKPPASKPASAAASVDRRTVSRTSVAERAERSRQLSRLLQFGALLVAIVAVAVIAATEVGGVLGRPFEAIEASLDPGHTPLPITVAR
jgi:hypothetical protein